jgi:hypothetical protein
VEFTVKFRRPVPLDGEIKAVGRNTRDSSRIFEGTGEIVLDDGTVAAEAQGKYLKMPIGEIASEDFSDSDWFLDPLPTPPGIVMGNDDSPQSADACSDTVDRRAGRSGDASGQAGSTRGGA